MIDFFKKYFGNKSDRDMKEITPLASKIHIEYEAISKLSTDQLRQKTIDFKAKIASFLNEEESEIKELRNKLENDLERNCKKI